MSADILACLHALLAPEKNVRVQAEERLKQFESQPGYCSELCRVLLDANGNVAHRQTAAALLKQVVKKRWDAKENVAPISDAEKAHLRGILLPALGDPIPLIRVSIAMVVSRIAHEDWPERWQDLLPILVNMLHTPNENVVHGAIQTLSMLVSDDTISDVHLPLIIKHLFPEVLAIFQSNTFSEQIRIKAAQIFEVAVNFVFMVQTPEADSLLKPVAPQWIETFIQAIIHTPPSTSRRDYGIPCTAIQALTTILKSSPNLLKSYLTTLLPVMWSTFTAALPLYEIAVVKGEEDALAGNVGEDGMAIDGLAKAVLEFMESLSEKKSIRKMMEPHLENIAYYSILTDDQAQLYEMDPNQYIADEEDDTFSYNPRVVATFILQTLAENYGAKGMRAIYGAIGKRMAESQGYASQPYVWATREATLLAIGSIAEEYAGNSKKASSSVLPPTALLKDLLLPLLMEQIPEGPNSTGLWYLKGRALWCAAQFAEVVDKEAALPFFHACCVLIEPANAGTIPVPVKMAAVKAIARFCTCLPADKLRSYIPSIMQVLCGIIPTASDDSLVLLLNSLLMLTTVAPDVTTDHAATLGPYVQHVWAHHAADPQLTEDAKEILLQLFKHPKGLIALHPSLSLTLHNALYHPDKLGDMLDASMDILRMVASSTYDPADPSTPQAQNLIHQLIQDLLPPIINIILKDDIEESLVRTGADCLAVLIRYTQCITPAFLQSATQAAHKLLTHKSELVQRRAGELVTQMINAYSAQLAPLLPEILLKVIEKLEKAQLSDTKQEMLLVFIRLINTQQDTKLIFDFLSGISVAGTNGLSFFIAYWTKWHENFSGSLNVKNSLAGLGKLFRSQDPRLESIQVPGELVVDVNAPRASRSKSKAQPKWSVVPLKLKILYIFAKEYQVLKTKSEEDEDELEEGEELEDEEDDDYSKEQDLADLMDELDKEGEEEEDEPLNKLDPLYSIPLGKLIEDWVKGVAQESQQVFVACAQQLPNELQQITHDILNTNNT